MSEDVRHSAGKAWKAFQVNYEDVFSRSDRLCEVCLTEQQIVALLSMTEYLYWPTRWVKNTGDVDRDLVQQFTENLERRLLMACCDENIPIQYRYSDEGVLQRSVNAGGNWMDAPEFDPRVYSPQFPKPTGDDPDNVKCIAAAGAAALVKAEVGEQLTDDMTRYTLAQVITDWVKTYIASSDPFRALLTLVANQIFALIIAVLRPALTDEVYHTFQCVLFCYMADDISFDLQRWSDVRSAITDQIGGIAGIFLEHLVYLLGTTGLTNLVRAGGAADGDCSDCGCDESCSIDLWYSGIVANGGTFYPYAETSRGGNQIVIPSFNRGDGTQEVSITTKLADVCCGFHVTTEPPIDLGLGEFYVPCGTTADYEHLIAMGVTPTTTPMNTYQIVKGSTPFVATFTFDVP